MPNLVKLAVQPNRLNIEPEFWQIHLKKFQTESFLGIDFRIEFRNQSVSLNKKEEEALAKVLLWQRRQQQACEQWRRSVPLPQFATMVGYH